MFNMKNNGVNGYDIATAVITIATAIAGIAAVVTGTKANNIRFNQWSNKWNSVTPPTPKT